MRGLWLELDESPLWQVGSRDPDRVSLFESQALHHPVREVHASLFGYELENTCVRRGGRVLGVRELEHPWRLDV